LASRAEKLAFRRARAALVKRYRERYAAAAGEAWEVPERRRRALFAEYNAAVAELEKTCRAQ
jgi:hypothetical protein